MAQTKITIRVDLTRPAANINYSTTGAVAGLLTSDVGRTIYGAGRPAQTGSRVFWEGILNQVLADIIAGNGGGS
jgi:hypothetical protein